MGPFPLIFLGFRSSPGKSIQNLSPYCSSPFWKYAFNFEFAFVLNSNIPLEFKLHAAKALEALSDSMLELKNKKIGKKRISLFLKNLKNIWKKF